MSKPNSPKLKTTPLLAIHNKYKAKLVPFAGWKMPIQYQGIIQEHCCVREGVGVFDVSHMGEIEIRGKDARLFLQQLMTNDIDKLSDGSILYSLMCYDNGGVVDDLLVHRYSENHYFLCVNASNVDKDHQWILDHMANHDVEVENISSKTAQLAVQGRSAEELLQGICDSALNDLKYYHFKKAKIHNIDCLISRTGYTGEDGFEIYCPADQAEALLTKILDEGQDFDIQLIGLGARDTLRLEMGYALYGNDISAESNPLEAGLGWVIKLNKAGDFIGKNALVKSKESGLTQKLVGIRLMDRGVPRPHYRVFRKGEFLGELTSGTYSPSLNMGIGLCYLSREYSIVGTRLEIEIRDKMVPIEVVNLPFVSSSVKK
jgi:aminomethyltransferase